MPECGGYSRYAAPRPVAGRNVGDGESDTRNYYDHVSARQELDLRPQLERLDALLLRSAGVDPAALSFEFRPLWQMDAAASAAIVLQKAQATQIYAGLNLWPASVTAKLVQAQLAEDGTYPGAEGIFAEAVRGSPSEACPVRAVPLSLSHLDRLTPDHRRPSGSQNSIFLPKGNLMLVHDGATALSRERTPEGFLRVKARIGRIGLHDYRAGEIGGPEGAPPDRRVRVYRPPDDVFDPQSLASFAGKAVTLDHPPRMVDAANWRSVAVGHAGSAVMRDDDHVAADLTITDAAAVARAEAGAQLSNGYWADFVFEPGVTPDGEPYDAVQRNIRGNHIALVDSGRCGSTCRIDATADAAPAACGCDAEGGGESERRRVTIEGLTVATDAAGEAALTRLQAMLDAARVHERATGAQDRAAGAQDHLSVPQPATLDALVAEHASVLDGARRLIGPAFEGGGRSAAEIRRLVVDRLIGPDKVRHQGDAYVTAAFDALKAARMPSNPLASQMTAGLDRDPSREAAIAARDRYLNHAWKSETGVF